MLASRATSALVKAKSGARSSLRWASTVAEKDKYKVVVVGAGMYRLSSCPLDVDNAWCIPGSGGLTVANQIYKRFKAAGKPLNEGDIAIVDAAENHYYQVRSMIMAAVLVTERTYHVAGMVS